MCVSIFPAPKYRVSTKPIRQSLVYTHVVPIENPVKSLVGIANQAALPPTGSGIGIPKRLKVVRACESQSKTVYIGGAFTRLICRQAP